MVRAAIWTLKQEKEQSLSRMVFMANTLGRWRDVEQACVLLSVYYARLLGLQGYR